MNPERLSVRPFEAPFRGAQRIHRFLGVEPSGIDAEAITWVGAASGPAVGVTSDGARVDELLRADPAGWLGPDLARYGPLPAFVVKLIDAGQRLMLHVHPDRTFASTHLGDPDGMAEAWVVLEARPGAVVHLGFAREVDAEELSGWVMEQDVAAMLGATNVVDVAAGDVVFVPPGVPHAVGEGILLAEIQQPTDRMVFLEWEGFPIEVDPERQLGVPLETVLGCVDGRPQAPEAWVTRQAIELGRADGGASLLAPIADRSFRIERLGPDASAEAAFAVVAITQGRGALILADGTRLAAEKGHCFLVPFEAGEVRIDGDMTAIRFRAPRPE